MAIAAEKKKAIDKFLKVFCPQFLSWEKKEFKKIVLNDTYYLLAPRQNGKTYLLEHLCIWLLFVEGKSIIFSSAKESNAVLFLRKLYKKVYGNSLCVKRMHGGQGEFSGTGGDTRMETAYGNFIIGVARGGKSIAGTGYSADIIIFDECQFLESRTMAVQLPTRITTISKLIYTGTAPTPQYDFFLKEYAKRKNDPNFSFYGTTKKLTHKASINDMLKVFAAVNPSYPELIKRENIIGNWEQMRIEDFNREHLNFIDETQTKYIFNLERMKKNIASCPAKFENFSVGIYSRNGIRATATCFKHDGNFYVDVIGLFTTTDSADFMFLADKKINKTVWNGNNIDVKKIKGKVVIPKYQNVQDANEIIKYLYEKNLLKLSTEDACSVFELISLEEKNEKIKYLADDEEAGAVFNAIRNAAFNEFHKQYRKSKIIG